MITGQSSYFF